MTLAMVLCFAAHITLRSTLAWHCHDNRIYSEIVVTH